MYVTTPIGARGEQAGQYLVAPGRPSALAGFTFDGESISPTLSRGPFSVGMAVRDGMKMPLTFGGPRLPAPGVPVEMVAPFLQGRGNPLPPVQAYPRHMPSPNYIPNQQMKGLAGPFDAILNVLGLRDPIATDYPGMSLSEVWTTVMADINLAKHKLPGLRSDRKRAELAGRIDQLYRIATDIAPAFRKADSQIGKRERDQLADLILKNDSYTKDWRAAKAAYGYADPDVEPPAPEAAPAGTFLSPPPLPLAIQSMGEGIPWAWIIGGALAAFGLYKVSKR